MVHELILTKSIYIRTPLYSVHRSSHFLVEMSRGIQKWSNICIHVPIKTPGPFCSASTLSGTQLQGQFFHSHFVGFYPVTRSFSISPTIDKKCFSIFARGQTVHLFANYDVFNKKSQSLLKPTFYYRMVIPTPFFFHRMVAYRGLTPTILWRKWRGGFL